VPIVDLASLAELNARSYSVALWLARAAAILGAVGVLLATAGLYGLMSYVVACRGRELAIRMALGAAPSGIMAMVLRQALSVTALGLAIGAAAGLAVTRLVQSEYHGVRGTDLVALSGAVVLFLAAMAAASAVPAWRAGRLDPVAGLKDS
jgi:putative ABC transport system permease protein